MLTKSVSVDNQLMTTQTREFDNDGYLIGVTTQNAGSATFDNFQMTYYTDGNPFETFQGVEGEVVNTVWFWGYDNKVIGQAVNLDTDGLKIPDFDTFTNSDDIKLWFEDLRDDYPEAQVTTYLYKLGVGVKEVVDPNGRSTHYIYDNFGRLKQVLDHDQNILSENHYDLINKGE